MLASADGPSVGQSNVRAATEVSAAGWLTQEKDANVNGTAITAVQITFFI